MEKITKYFTHDYENDTTVEYVNTGLYSMLNCSFTSEDPDYGTDTIHYKSNVEASIEQMAYEMLCEVKNFLDWRGGTVEAPMCHVQNDYGEYSNSTLIAIESALMEITKNYRPNKWFLTIREAGKLIADKMISGEAKSFGFCQSSKDEQTLFRPDQYKGDGWYGIKRIEGFFDNQPDELIVAVGYYGGGNCTFAYVDRENILTRETYYAITKAICDATGQEEDDIIFVEMDKEEDE